MVAAAREVHGSVGIECGFLYSMLDADSFVMPGSHRSAHRYDTTWPISSLRGTRVPLVNLVCSGLWSIESGMNLRWQNVAEAILLGRHPRTEWAAHAGFRGAHIFSDLLAQRLAAFYELSLKKLGRLQSQAITRWESLGPNLERTTFEDGTRIKLDYTTGQLWVNDELIDPPTYFADSQATSQASSAHA